MWIYSRAMVVMFAAGVAVSAQAETLNLQCRGEGSANETRTTMVQVQNNSGGSAWGTAQRQDAVGFSDQVDFKIDGDQATIRMPRSMLPTFHGGDDGWMKVKHLEISDREITGKVAVNPINSPKLRIDRLTGVLSLNGKAGSFIGDCRAFDPSSATRQF